MNKKILHFKINVKNKMIAFKTRCKKCRKLNKKYFTFGFYTILGIFGITLLLPALPSVAKDLPQNITKYPVPPH